MDHPQELIGKKLGKCIIERPLARGGYGFSYLGYDSELEKKRLIKVSQAAAADKVKDLHELKDFKREGYILSRLKHPQIVSLMEQGEAYGYHYMILDYIEGFDFSRVLRILRNRQKELACWWSGLLDPVTALAITVSALEPLAYAHQARISLPGEEAVEGLAHRDISTGNLMLGCGHEYQGQVHLIDFGTAKSNFNLSSTLDFTVVGSIKYMSPSRFMKKSADTSQAGYWKNFRQTQYDVHAIGSFLWELLRGAPHINITDRDPMDCLADLHSRETYRDLYTEAEVFNRDIQSIIRKSVVLPDVKRNRIPFQYRDAAEMLSEVRNAYDRMSGNAPVNQVLAQLSREIQDPQLMNAPQGLLSDRVKRFSKTGKIEMGFTPAWRPPVRALTVALLAVALIGASIWFFSALTRSVPREEKQGMEQSIRPRPEVPAETPQKPKPPAQAQNRKLVKPVVKKKTPKTHSQTQSKKASAPGKPTAKEIQQLKEDYKQLQALVREGRVEQAYKKVSRMIAVIRDPAVLLIKADLLFRKNPQSAQIGTLVDEARGQTSIFMSEKQIEMKIKSLLQSTGTR